MIPWGMGIGPAIADCARFFTDWSFLAWRSCFGEARAEPSQDARLEQAAQGNGDWAARS